MLCSWADWTREGGPEWFDWYIGQLASVPGLHLLPNLFYTPPGIARKDSAGEQKTSYPPQDLSSYATFVRTIIERYGEHFDWVELWNEPNWNPYWSWDMDPDGTLFASMAIDAADTVHELGKKALLGGTTPLDYAWFGRMHELGLLSHVDAISFHFSPSWDNQHRHWMPLTTELRTIRALLEGFGLSSCEVWLDEIGFSTKTSKDQDEEKLEGEQVRFFDEMRKLPVEHMYWFCLLDQEESVLTDDAINAGDHPDPTAYHFGLITCEGRKKPLYHHWKKLAEDRKKFE
jgi:CDP-paratose 2-epimerase